MRDVGPNCVLCNLAAHSRNRFQDSGPLLKEREQLVAEVRFRFIGRRTIRPFACPHTTPQKALLTCVEEQGRLLDIGGVNLFEGGVEEKDRQTWPS